MSGGTSRLLMALFMVAAAMGYPSRRSATDLDATPRTTVTFDASVVSASPAASSWLERPHDFSDLVSEAQLSG
ncbi:semaphorin-4g isoform x1 [Limosa lapponica baueri]|uniref:Semaphorin-4g isoform x1 n=1 Tax=Limosa lapponica baueri TaxID=1758121 RepID=A0A2I0T2M6_LIMLA|nr:semaphorin-4g isoform x1 [Limosa lapponica baueri]